MAERSAAGFFKHGRGAAGHEVGGLPRHSAQSVSGAQHRQSPSQSGEIHGHRRTTEAQVNDAGQPVLSVAFAHSHRSPTTGWKSVPRTRIDVTAAAT